VGPGAVSKWVIIITRVSGDDQEVSFLFQRISVLLFSFQFGFVV